MFLDHHNQPKRGVCADALIARLSEDMRAGARAFQAGQLSAIAESVFDAVPIENRAACMNAGLDEFYERGWLVEGEYRSSMVTNKGLIDLGVISADDVNQSSDSIQD